MDETFSFDDILLIPDYSNVEHGDINISNEFFKWDLQVPVLSSPMDTITGIKMIQGMYENGAVGIHHRYCPLIDVRIVARKQIGSGVAISPSWKVDSALDLLNINPDLVFVLDVAHGDTKRNLDFCEKLVKMGANVVSGNIVTDAAAMRYYNIGVKYLRVGIGAGSVCTTRAVTGVGYPQASAIIDIAALREEYTDIKIISDGGHRTLS